MKRILLLITAIALSTQAHAWTVARKWEDGTVGVTGRTPDSFDGNAGQSSFVADPAIVLQGKMSGSVSIMQGQTGFGHWGGSFDYPTELKEGDEVWFRVNVMYPAGWDFSCGGCRQGVKFMRIHTASAGGANEGYLDTLILGNTTGGKITAGSEVMGPDFWNNNGGSNGLFGLGTDIVRGQWTTYEQHIKFSSVPGRAVYRIWQNGKLIFEDTKTATLRSSSSKSDFIYLYTYWNNGAPRTQTSYIDDVVITSDTPSNRDAHGNPYIGTGNYTYVAPPNPPSSIQ